MLWSEFNDRFLEASEAILGRGSPETRLPGLWVDLVEQRGPHCTDQLRTEEYHQESLKGIE